MANRKESSGRFVVQQHDARTLHYNFRLEKDGVFKSWAVPKGVPLEIGARRLAIKTVDHDLDFGDFEGEIPEGQYGDADSGVAGRGGDADDVSDRGEVVCRRLGQIVRAEGGVTSEYTSRRKNLQMAVASPHRVK